MWIFTSGGALMPSLAPLDKADPEFTLGYRDLQVRGRVRSHLENFIRDYMEPWNLDYSDIEMTDDMDYDARFYTTQSAFAMAMSLAIHDIDYKTFKETSERRDDSGRLLYADGKKYHDALLRVWSTMAREGNPYGGGQWGGKWASGTPRHTTRTGSGSSSTIRDRYEDQGGYWPTAMGDADIKTNVPVGRERPSVGSLVAAGVRDADEVLRAWEEQEEAEQRHLDALEEREAMLADLSDDERAAMEALGWADEDGQEGQFDRIPMVLVSEQEQAKSFEPTQYKSVPQLLAMARYIPLSEWAKVFDEDEIEYLRTRAQTWALEKAQYEAKHRTDPETGEVTKIPKAERAEVPVPILTPENVKTIIIEIQMATEAKKALAK